MKSNQAPQEVNVQANYAKFKELEPAKLEQPVKNQYPQSYQNYPNTDIPNYPSFENNTNKPQGDPTTAALIDASKSLASGLKYVGQIFAKGF